MRIDTIGELFGDLTGDFNQGVRGATHEIGKLVKRTASDYAPKSPTQQVKTRVRKTKRATSKNPRATSGRTPGGLERSIAFEAETKHVDIFVPAQSEAADYAAIIHDMKGVKWRNRGPGTIAKGAKADEKFIIRAIEDNEANIDRIIEHETGKALGG